MNNKSFWQAGGATLILLVVYYACYGIFFERYIIFSETIYSGTVNGSPVNDIQNLAYIGLMKLFALGYKTFPAIAWSDLAHIIQSFFTGMFFLYLVASGCRQRTLQPVLSACILLLAAALVYLNFLYCNGSREAIMLAGMCLLLMGKTGRKWQYTGLLLVYLIACLIRWESAVVGSAVFGGFAIFYPWRFTQKWKSYVLPALILFGIGAYLYYDKTFSNDYARQTDYSQYLVSDTHLMLPPHAFKTIQDSMRYEAAVNLWLTDTANLKIDFYKSLEQYKIGFTRSYLKNYMPVYAWGAFKELNYYFSQNLPLCLLVVLVALWRLMAYRHSRVEKLKTIGVLFACYILLFALSYLVKMEFTIMEPVLLLLAVLLWYNLWPATVTAHTNLRNSVWVALFGVAAVYANVDLYNRYMQRKFELNGRRAAAIEANQLTQGKYLMLDGSSNFLYDHRPFDNYRFKGQKALLLYDMGQLLFDASFLNYHQRICHCNALNNKAFYSFLATHRHELLLVSFPERMAFVFSYLKIMHGLDIGYRELPGNYALNKQGVFFSPLRYYELTLPQDSLLYTATN